VLSDKLRREVIERDRRRCRWCGQPGERVGIDVHHIRYRRGDADDHPGNLISLCRSCHGFVHGLHPNSPRKAVAQLVLYMLLEQTGVTGSQLLRRERRKGTFKSLE
jgi:hypothetical protein